jgi:hypothetical protein
MISQVCKKLFRGASLRTPTRRAAAEGQCKLPDGRKPEARSRSASLGENRTNGLRGGQKADEVRGRSIRPRVLFSQIQILTTKDSEHAGLNDFMLY